MRRTPALALLVAALAACGSPPPGESIEVVIPPGADFGEVVDSLVANDLVSARRLFGLYARARGADRDIRAGRYALAPGTSWGDLVETLTEGRILPRALTIPEGWTLQDMVPRVAEFSAVPEEEVETLLLGGDSIAARLGVPGPGLEGYLLPDTYLLAEGIDPRSIVETMAAGYRDYWTPDRRAALEALGMTERELVTLASIVQAEAGNVEEMDRIAAVYHNRLRAGWLLQADPTVLYALGGHRDRLLFAAIDSVADHPYNTYRQPGLPPGPIGSPGVHALDAALAPADVPYMFFVAGPDGGHIFSTTLSEHNRAVADYRRRAAAARSAEGREDAAGTP